MAELRAAAHFVHSSSAASSPQLAGFFHASSGLPWMQHHCYQIMLPATICYQSRSLTSVSTFSASVARFDEHGPGPILHVCQRRMVVPEPNHPWRFGAFELSCDGARARARQPGGVGVHRIRFLCIGCIRSVVICRL